MEKKKVICFGFPKWEGEYLKSTVQLVKKLSKDHDMVYVDYPYTITDLLRSIIGNKVIPALKIIGLKKRVDTVLVDNENTCLLYRLPPILPTNWIKSPGVYDFFCKINGHILLYSLKQMTKKYGFMQPVVINAFNPWLGLFMEGRLNEQKLIYYCYDEISQAPWISRHGERLERKFISKVDNVIVSSKKLYEEKKKYNSNIYLIQNGVDIGIFGKEPTNVGLKFKKSTQKIIGFLGSLDLRVDLSLVLKAVSSYKDYDFHFVGRVVSKEAKAQLEGFPNVFLCGPKPPSSLYKEIDRMDVCIIPFKSNELTSAIYPLKINEYLIRGKPVISTNFSDLSDFQDLINIARNHQEFLDILGSRDLFDSDEHDIRKRKTFALSNSWENRAETFSKIVNSL